MQMHKTDLGLWMTTLLLLLIPAGVYSEPAATLEHGRNLFYRAVTSETALDSAVTVFDSLHTTGSVSESLVEVYLGSLTCLKGKHTFWPQKKYRHVKEGLVMMDNAVKQDPDNVEVLFIRATTTFYLPSFFGHNQQALDDMNKLSRLLPEVSLEYPAGLILNVGEFLLENAQLNSDSRTNLQAMLTGLGS